MSEQKPGIFASIHMTENEFTTYVRLLGRVLHELEPRDDDERRFVQENIEQFRKHFPEAFKKASEAN